MRILLFILAFIIPITSGQSLSEEGIFLHLLNDVFIKSMEKLGLIEESRNKAVIANAAYEALVPYLENSVAIYAQIPRRPVEERTIRNKNIAIAYAMLRVGLVQLPQTRNELEQIFNTLGLNMNDNSMDLSSPIGIGNFAAQQVLQVRLHDGYNQLGDMNGKKYNRRPYEDYTGYVPKNTAYELKDAGKWQPDIVLTGSDGEYVVQQVSKPQRRLAKTYYLNVKEYSTPVPVSTDPRNEGYKTQVDDILKLSSELNDYTKMASEHFDSFQVYHPVLLFLIKKHQLNQDETVKLTFLVYSISFDGYVLIGQEKMKYDAVRPFSAVRFLYNNTKIRAWGGPGVGTVDDITGREWKPYLQTHPTPEYPSGASIICGCFFTVLKNYFKSDELGYEVLKQKGSSKIEPLMTPARDVVLGPYRTYDDYINECGMGRRWGGVHFKAAVEVGKQFGRRIGSDGYKIASKNILGVV